MKTNGIAWVISFRRIWILKYLVIHLNQIWTDLFLTWILYYDDIFTYVMVKIESKMNMFCMNHFPIHFGVRLVLSYFGKVLIEIHILVLHLSFHWILKFDFCFNICWKIHPSYCFFNTEFIIHILTVWIEVSKVSFNIWD